MTKAEMINDYLFTIADSDLIELWNEYCDDNYCSDQRVYQMDELDELLHGCTATEILESVDSDFSTYDDYFIKDDYDLLESHSDVFDIVDIDELTDYIIDNSDSEYGFGFVGGFSCYELDELVTSEAYTLAS